MCCALDCIFLFKLFTEQWLVLLQPHCPGWANTVIAFLKSLLNCSIYPRRIKTDRNPHTADGLWFVRSIAAVVVEVTIPTALYTSTIGTRKLHQRTARPVNCTANTFRLNKLPRFSFQTISVTEGFLQDMSMSLSIKNF